MADLQVGNHLGVAAVGKQDTLLASITADNGTDNVVNVDSLAKLKVGMVIDILHRTTGVATAGATSRTITKLENDGGTFEVTYDGADVDPTNAYGIYPAGTFGDGSEKTNVNGGYSDRSGLEMPDILTIEDARTRLTAISGSYYTTARLNQMTYNDMIFAIRRNDEAGSIQE